MKIEEIDSAEYSKLFPEPFILYNSVAFNKIVSHKCDKLIFLLFNEDKKKLGLISGIINNRLCTPFSAPYSFFSFQDDRIKNTFIVEALEALEEYSSENKLFSLKFVLPPCFYGEHIISKFIYSFFLKKYLSIVDDNHFFNTKDYIKYEEGTIKKGVRYNIKVAVNAGMTFHRINDMSDYMIAYDIIRKNKETKDRPLKMSFEQILEMRSLVDIDWYLIYLKDQPVASAIVYVYSPRIAQIIYWGDLPDYHCYYPMNFLAMNLFRVYYERKLEIIDLGNASCKSIPNYGLSNFKEVIGCTATLKFTFYKQLQETDDTPKHYINK